MIKGGDMIKRRTIQAAVVALVLAAPAPIAHAAAEGRAASPAPSCSIATPSAAPRLHVLDMSISSASGPASTRRGEAPLHTRSRRDHIGNAEPGTFHRRRPYQVLRGPAQGHQPESPESRHRSVRHGDGKVGVQQYVCVGAFKCDVERRTAHPPRSEAVPAGTATKRRHRPGRRARASPGPAPAAGRGPRRLPRRRSPSCAAALEAVCVRARGSYRVRRAASGGQASVASRAGSPRREHHGAQCASAEYLELCRTTVSLLRRLAGRRFSTLPPPSASS